MTFWQTNLRGDGFSTDTAYEPDIPSGIRWALVSVDYENRICVISTEADLLDAPGCTPSEPPPSPDVV